jgi:hypothetical protein
MLFAIIIDAKIEKKFNNSVGSRIFFKVAANVLPIWVGVVFEVRHYPPRK